MSQNIHEANGVTVTRYYGGEKNGVMIQISTTEDGAHRQVRMSMTAAARMAVALLRHYVEEWLP